tara:strand:- start:489 stop:914 length:426 start_codon:yes stop_codon:yes gene_type:complete
MTTLIKNNGSANEKNVEGLLEDTREWYKLLYTSSEELTFLNQFLTADIFSREIPNLYEELFLFSSNLETLKMEKTELHQLISNHKNDLNGMMECEDISCESFYFSEHMKLEKKLDSFLSRFNCFQSNLFRFCTNKLRVAIS